MASADVASGMAALPSASRAALVVAAPDTDALGMDELPLEHAGLGPVQQVLLFLLQAEAVEQRRLVRLHV